MLRRVIFFVALVLVLSLTNISLMNAQLSPSLGTETYLLIVNNDGSVYKFNPASRNVLWHTSLSTSFISFNHSSPHKFDQTEYFLPNFDGNFIYVSQRNQPMAIERNELQQLLNRCFDKHSQYFLYDSVDYYVLNMETGNVKELKTYLDQHSPMEKENYVIRIDKKYLKSLDQTLQQKWSVISSQIAILSIKQFIKNSKAQNQAIKNKYYKFYRNSGTSIQIVDSITKQHYELQSESSFITIFSIQNHKVYKHNIQTGLSPKEKTPQLQGTSEESELGLELHLIEYENIIKSNPKNEEKDVQSMEFCINSLRVLENESIKQFRPPQLAYSYASSVDREASLYTQFAIGGFVLFTVGICLGWLFTRIKKQIQTQMQNNNSDIQKRIEKVQKQLQQSKNIPKNLPYSIKYEDLKRTHTDVKVYVSTILSKEAQVSIFPLKSYQSILHKVESVKSINNKRIVKIWHHEIKEEEYLIFTDKITHTLEEHISSLLHLNTKEIFGEIIDMMKALHANNIKISCMSPYHIVVDDDGQFKYNALVPDSNSWCSSQILEGKQPSLASDLFMLGNILYFVYSKGQTLFLFQNQQKDAVIESFNKLKYNKQSQIKLQNDYAMTDLLIELFSNNEVKLDLTTITNHIFFWSDAKALAFVNEFSNYMETHLDDQKVKKFEMSAKESTAIPSLWSKQLPKQVLVDIISYRKYDFGSIRDIIRVIRNKSSHFHEVPENVRRITGRTKEQLCRYFLVKFPKLLYFMYKYSQKKKWKLHGFF